MRGSHAPQGTNPEKQEEEVEEEEARSAFSARVGNIAGVRSTHTLLNTNK